MLQCSYVCRGGAMADNKKKTISKTCGHGLYFGGCVLLAASKHFFFCLDLLNRTKWYLILMCIVSCDVDHVFVVIHFGHVLFNLIDCNELVI